MRRAGPPTSIGFRRSDPSTLATAIESAAGRGDGWINVRPDPDEVDPRVLGRPSVFSGRGPTIPMGTFVVGAGGGEHQVGIEHGAGKDVARLLKEAGVAFPSGTRLVQDHPRRGLILAVPTTTPAAELATLILRIASELTSIALTDRWIADIY